VKVWDLSTRPEVIFTKVPGGVVSGVAFSPDGGRLAVAGWDCSLLQVWDAETGQVRLTFEFPLGASNWSAVFSPDGRRLASTRADGTVWLWDAANGQKIHELKGHEGQVSCVAFSPDGRRLASASWDNTVKLWDTDSGQEVLTLTGHDKPVFSVAFDKDGRRLASASWDGTLRIWDARPREPRR
jgi:WD40 repeat protein